MHTHSLLTSPFEWLQIVAVIFGALSVYYSVYVNKHLWLTGIVSEVAYAVLFIWMRFYAQVMLQLVFIGLNIFGWLRWEDAPAEEDAAVSALTRTSLLGLAMLSVAVSLAVGFYLKTTTHDPLPLSDTVITVTSIIAQCLLCYKKIENWYFWIVTDMLSIIVYADKGIYLSSALYVGLLVLAVQGLIVWRKRLICV